MQTTTCFVMTPAIRILVSPNLPRIQTDEMDVPVSKILSPKGAAAVTELTMPPSSAKILSTLYFLP